MWLVAVAAVRFQHVMRSRPLARTSTAVWFIAYRGKQKVAGVRLGFKWCAPRVGVTGVPVGDFIWEAWHRIAASTRTQKPQPELPQYLSFDPSTGKPVRMQKAVDLVREKFCGLFVCGGRPERSLDGAQLAP